MGTLYIGIIMFCRVAQSMCNKRTSNKMNGITMFVHYGAFRQIISGLLGLLLIIVGGNGFHANGLCVLISIFSGIMLVISMCCSIYAMKSGTMALTSMFSTAGLLVPCIAGIFLFNTPMSIGQWIGVGLFFVSSWFLITSSRQIVSGFCAKTLLLLVGGMLSNGCVMLAQQMFSHYVKHGDVSVFSFFSFGIVGLALLIAVKPTAKMQSVKVERLPRELIVYGIILSVAVFIINQLATLASGFVSPAILFTFINGGGTIISTIVAALMFHEKLTVRSTLGVILGITSLIIIKTC